MGSTFKIISDTGTRSQIKPKPRATHIYVRSSPPSWFHPAALAPATAQSGAHRTYQKSRRSPQAAPSPAGAERDPARPAPQPRARPRPQEPSQAVLLALTPGGSPPPPTAGMGPPSPQGPAATRRTPHDRPSSPTASRRGRARSPLRRSGAAATVEGGHGRTHRHTHPPPPRPPPPGSPHLRHVPARPPPPAYLPRASPTPASRHSSSPIGGQRARPPAQPPVFISDWLKSPPLNSRPASKHAPNGAALRGALSLVGGVAGSAG